MLPSPIFIFAAAFVCIIVLLFMRPRRFYFVRHGETLANIKHIRQGEEGGLSENGQHQAEQVGKDLAQLSIARIISSPYPRAKETATIINTYIHAPIHYSTLLRERRNPSEIIGQDRDKPEVARIIDQIDLSYHNDDYRFSDEENFIDLKKRAKKCLAFLSRQSASETCVITHHVFLKMLLSYMLHRERLHAADFAKLSFFNTSDNAGISICEFHPWKMFSSTRGWEVVTYNQSP
ncbi:MAG: histidine phosphatase family protein [Candidatus Kaiserbacteria bacterium]|nr:histidine phosphatase family protein [Candidatus Kaiserbacteria bacterium]